MNVLQFVGLLIVCFFFLIVAIGAVGSGVDDIKDGNRWLGIKLFIFAFVCFFLVIGPEPG